MGPVVVNSLPEEIWRDFVDRHPDGNIFHTPEMFRVAVESEWGKPEFWAAINAGRVLALFLPIRVSLHNGRLRYFTTRSVAFGSVLCAPGPEGLDALRLLLQAYKKNGGTDTLFTELRNISKMDAYQPILAEQGFVFEDHLNYIIDLEATPDVVFQRIGKRTRKNIRNGLNRGRVEIREVTEKTELFSCYELLRKTYQAARVPLASPALFEAAFEFLYPQKMICFSLASVAGSPAAVSIELLYKGVAYGWYGGMDRCFGAYNPNDLLMWYVLKSAAESGFVHYDFGGAGRPDEQYGVRDFKAKFGGRLVNYGRNIWAPRPFIVQVCKLGYEAYRRFM